MNEERAKSPAAENLLATTGVLLWTLLPSVAIWLGLYELKSAAWSFIIYHGTCLLPGIIWGRSHWLPGLRLPRFKHLIVLFFTSALFSFAAVLLYEHFGHKVLSNEHVVGLMQGLGFSKLLFWPLCLYLLIVNPLVEELFWRGVIFDTLDKSATFFKNFGLVWSSATYAAFHYWIFRLVLFSPWSELGILMLAVYGAALALIYRKAGSILTVALVHGLLTDLAVIVLIIDLVWHNPSLRNALF